MSFQDRVDGVVRDFLETALVVDDAALGLAPTVRAPDAVTLPESPKVERASKAPKPRVRLDLELVEPPDADDVESVAHAVADEPLKTRVLIDSFADDGIICSVIAPLRDDDVHKRVLKAAARADLLVFDWELHRDGGAVARALVKGVLEQDASADRRRLRVIAIYTSQPRLFSIMESVAEHLGLAQAEIQDSGLTLVKDGLRIVGLMKPVVKKPPKALAARRVDEADLPRRLASEFARLTDGLVPSVALGALAAVRNDTHRILQALGPHLDIAYLGHRVASPFPKETEGHLVALISAEIASILEDKDVGSHADIGAIGDWLDEARHRSEAPLKSGSALAVPRDVDAPALTRMLTDGLGLDAELKAQAGPGVSKADLRKMRRQAAYLFTNEPDLAALAHDKFALRMAVRTLYSLPHRVLRLGTVVLREGEFMLCVQPRCDSVRIPVGEIRAFPFLPLVVVAEGDLEKHQFVMPDPRTGELVRLKLLSKPLDLIVGRFRAGADQCVEAVDQRGRWFVKNSQGHPYAWVAELKAEFAQRVAVDLGNQLARVGLTESELVRASQ